MPILTAIIIVLLVCAGMWTIWLKTPEPWKTILNVVLAIALTLFLLGLMGLLDWLKGATV